MEIQIDQLEDLLKNESIQLIDIRGSEELKLGVIPDSIHVPQERLLSFFSELTHNKNQKTVLYCARGKRSLNSASDLHSSGYQEVYSLAGGFEAWLQQDKPIANGELSSSDTLRFARHISLPQVGTSGQKKLLKARVLIVGLGGLGCPIAQYLAAAGIGTIGLMDHDLVSLSNLQRQILYSEADVGKPKVEQAKEKLLGMNSNLEIITYPFRFDESRKEIFNHYDIIINGTDNFTARYLLNDSCVEMQKPLVDGAITQFEGQVSVYHPQKEGPCYRCLYPDPPPKELLPNCAEAGVFGVLPGWIGVVQATETIKLILDLGDSLIGKLYIYDALSQSVRSIKTKKNEACPVCNT